MSNRFRIPATAGGKFGMTILGQPVQYYSLIESLNVKDPDIEYILFVSHHLLLIKA